MDWSNVLRDAKRLKLDLKVRQQAVDLRRVQKVPWTGYSREYIERLADLIQQWQPEWEWPEKLPFVILGRFVGGTPDYVILDGHHRVKAARLLKMETIPALVVSYNAFEKLEQLYGMTELPFIEFLASQNKELRQDLALHRRDWQKSGP
jgi:hypothetical protein